MSSTYKKIKYEQEGSYGSTEKKTLYVHFNNTSDYITFKDEDGDTIFGFGEWGFDLGQAIVKVLSESNDKLESCTLEEREKIFK